MKRIIVGVLVCVVIAVSAFAQDDQISWYTSFNPVGPGGSGSTVPYNDTNVTLGALAQLIVCYNTTSTPVWSGNGASGDNVVQDWTGCGYGVFDATFAKGDTLPNYGLAATNYVFVRLWDRPTSGSGNMPASFNYGGGNEGAYYFDSAVFQISALQRNGSFYNLDTGAIVQGSWTLLAIPEPGSMALGLIGLGVILIRRRLIRR